MWLRYCFFNILLLLLSFGATGSNVIRHGTIFARDSLQFDFKIGKDTIGSCETINLRSRLKPNLPGKFFIDGIEAQDDKFNATLVDIGVHKISYKIEGQNLHHPINIFVAAPPTLTITPRDTALCLGNEPVDFKILPNGYGPFNLEYETRTERRNGGNPDVRPIDKYNLKKSFIVEEGYKFENDSFSVITPLSLTDRFNCPASNLDSAKVNFSTRPEFRLLGRYPQRDGSRWEFASYYPYIISEGEYIDYKISFLKGMTPWYHETRRTGVIGPIYGKDTIFRATAAGAYRFSVRNVFYCMSETVNSQIFFKKDGYLRIRTILEGPSIKRGEVDYMRADLQRLGILQETFPAIDRLARVPIAPTDSIVDLIVVELREKMDSPPIAKDTFLLRNDGQLLTRTGNDTLVFANADKLMDANNYYIVLSHRNHLSVISSNRVGIVSKSNKKSVRSYDFTKGGNAWCPQDSKLENHMSKISDGFWVMSAGYPNLTKLAPIEELQGAASGYYWLDVNLNGIVEFPANIDPGFIFDDNTPDKVEIFKNKDFWMMYRNRDKYSAVPSIKQAN